MGWLVQIGKHRLPTRSVIMGWRSWIAWTLGQIWFGSVPVSVGETYYVSPTGSDEAAGTIDQPWATLLRSVRDAGPDDIVYVRGGTYDEGEVWIRDVEGHGGAPGALLTIAAFPGESPVFVNASRPIIIDADYIRIEGLNLRNGKSIGIWGNDRTDVQIVNNSFRGSGYGYDAISTSGNNILLEGNLCDIEGNSVGTQGHCYYIHHGKNIVVRNNTARGMTGYGIHVFDQRRSEDSADFFRVIENVLIEGNQTFESEQRAGIIVAASDGARIENVVIRNNLVYNNGGAGIVVRSQAKQIQIHHNTVSNNADMALSLGGTDSLEDVFVRNNIFDLGEHRDEYHVWNELAAMSSITIENNLFSPTVEPEGRFRNIEATNSILADPRFVDPSRSNLQLQSDSPAIDRGLPDLNVSTDFAGNVRPLGQGYDIGAFEFPPLPRLLGDANDDQIVNFADFLILSAAYGRIGTWRDGDFDRDGSVAFADFLLLAQNYGKIATSFTPTISAIPEPTSYWLRAVAVLVAHAVIRGRRNQTTVS